MTRFLSVCGLILFAGAASSYFLFAYPRARAAFADPPA